MWKLILASGAEHLKAPLEKKGYQVFTSGLNYDGKRFFYNGDLYTRIEEIEKLQGENVCVIQSGSYSGELEQEKFTTQDRIFEVLQILHLLNDPHSVEEVGHKRYVNTPLENPRDVFLLLTCMPSGKQDHAVRTGECNSARNALDLFLNYCPRVGIIDPHPWNVEWFNTLKATGKVIDLSMVPRLLEEIGRRFPGSELVAPDEGAQVRLGLDGFGKKRTSSVESTLLGDVPVEGKALAFVDDLILTGGTLLKTREHTLKKGASRFAFAATHALPLMTGEDNLRRLVGILGEDLLVTNTVPSKTFIEEYPELALDCTPLIDEVLRSQT
ncbi:MAG: ribose-phosphate pyrophosphokinase [Theionarchaea archaeon]|nr:ribose-phosphate pyrophosphokinase [Theionarchaea archaeon]MBU7038228.1 ribose-phosphate pyrophosphokinase [Theionarchaea archaeon]